jgi:two-component system phosphate regulon sensor histidine kinase PhoR
LSLFRDPVLAAIRALEEEAAGGPRADLTGPMETLASLLLERESRLRTIEREQPERDLLAAVPDAAGLLSRDGRFRVANKALEWMAPGTRAVGLTVVELTRNADLAEAARRALEGTPKRVETEIGDRGFTCNLTPLVRGEVLVLLRDVTEQRRADVTRRDFVANASHELRTPVTAIAGAAETLLTIAPSDPAQARMFLDIISRNAARLTQLTRDLLDLSRIESRQWAIQLQPVELAPVVQGAVEACSGPARTKGIELRADVPPGLMARADAKALEHVLVNLLDNAVKYTPEGGRAGVEASGGDDGVIISVSDTGPGIERHHLARIFERFYRVDAGRARDAGGTGLGLAIVKHLVQAQGGEINVESGSGGTRFRLRLSSITPPPGASTHPEPGSQR